MGEQHGLWTCQCFPWIGHSHGGIHRVNVSATAVVQEVLLDDLYFASGNCLEYRFTTRTTTSNRTAPWCLSWRRWGCRTGPIQCGARMAWTCPRGCRHPVRLRQSLVALQSEQCPSEPHPNNQWAMPSTSRSVQSSIFFNSPLWWSVCNMVEL